jgi:hypothetical protein
MLDRDMAGRLCNETRSGAVALTRPPRSRLSQLSAPQGGYGGDRHASIVASRATLRSVGAAEEVNTATA